MTQTYEYQYIRESGCQAQGFQYRVGTYVIRTNVTTKKGDGWMHAWFLMDGGEDTLTWEYVEARSEVEGDVIAAWQNVCRSVLDDPAMWKNAVLEFTPAGAMVGLALTIEVARIGTEIVHESGQRDHRW